jgi:hypothetical protein
MRKGMFLLVLAVANIKAVGRTGGRGWYPARATARNRSRRMIGCAGRTSHCATNDGRRTQPPFYFDCVVSL